MHVLTCHNTPMNITDKLSPKVVSSRRSDSPEMEKRIRQKDDLLLLFRRGALKSARMVKNDWERYRFIGDKQALRMMP